MSRRELAGKHANKTVGRVCGVKPTDTKIEAAEKAIAIMKLADMPTKKAEQMLADYKRRIALES